MKNETQCKKCGSENVYSDGVLLVCPDCGDERSRLELSTEANSSEGTDESIRDSNGNILKEGDSVTVIKDLKLKGMSSAIKAGTKVKSIHLMDEVDGHNISCKLDGFGSIYLKSEFVRKA